MSKNTYDHDKGKQFTVLWRTSEMGRSAIGIECPHCQGDFRAYIWSMCGGGKKCPDCGAMHTSYGMAYPVAES